MNLDLPIDEILEALDLTRAQPGMGLLEALFVRFNARVPFETASKILRQADVADPAEKPRRADLFWRDHLMYGTGGTCFARVAAFDALLRDLGFASRKLLGRVEREFDHAAVLVTEKSGRWICDVGFPLPAIVAAQEGSVASSLADLAVARTPRGFAIELQSGVPEGPRRLEVFESEVSDEEFQQRWRETFRPESPFLSGVALRRLEPSRAVAYARGEIRVDDRHSRLTLPAGEAPAVGLSELFAIDADLLSKAFAIVPPPQSVAVTAGARLRVYLETAASPARAFETVGDALSYQRLLEGVARVTLVESGAARWRLALALPGAVLEDPAPLSEEVTAEPERLALSILRSGPSASFASEMRVEAHEGRTYLVREAFFDGRREDLLRNDSMRGRLAGTLSADLLAWSRRIHSSG